MNPKTLADIDVEREVTTAMNDVALVDRSHAGMIRVTGADRLEFLHRLSTNDLIGLSPHTSRGTVFLTDKGRIIDYVDVLVFPDSLLLVTSPGQDSAVKNWIDKYIIMEDVQLSIVTAKITMLFIIGPNGYSLIKSLVHQAVKPNSLIPLSLDGIGCTVYLKQEFSRQAFVALVDSSSGSRFLDRLGKGIEKGASLLRMNNTSYECYRILTGIPMGERELCDVFNPLEVNLRDAISFKKGCYIGQEIIARLDTYQKKHRGLIGLRLGEAIDYHELPARLTVDGEEIGLLTSCSDHKVYGSYPALGVAKIQSLPADFTVDIHGQSTIQKGIIAQIFK